MDQAETEPAEARRAISLTLAAMWAERGAASFWPLASWALTGASALALGALSGLTGQEALAGAGLWAAGLVVLGAHGVMRFRRPSRDEARARVDRRLPGAPLSVLRDRVAVGTGDAGAEALWRAHLAQAGDAARRAGPVGPAPALARRDPFALRLAALTTGAMALIFGGAGPAGDGLRALASNFRPAPGIAPEAAATGPGWEGWAEPPAYTRRPTIYLNALAEDAALSVPKGTVFSLRLYGSGLAVEQSLGTARDGAAAEAPEFTAEQSGVLRVGGRELAVAVEPDAPPAAVLAAAAPRRADGKFVQGFTASDDHGVAGGTALITLDLAAVDRRFGLAVAPEPRESVRLDVPLPGANARARVEGRIGADLARHPWANLPVTVTLTVRDGIGQEGTAPVLHMVLPGRRFFNSTAAALAEIRRDVLWSPANGPRAAQNLRSVMWDPEGAEPSLDPVLAEALSGVVGTLETGPLDEAARDRVAAALWDAAVTLEDGGLNDALARMQAAQEKLSEAIRNGASPDEIRKLMDELKAATDAYTEMLAQQGDDPAEKFDRSPRDGRMITGDQIQAMMDRIQALMNEGRMAEAQELLDQFNRMMESLKVTQQEGGSGSRPMQKLRDTLDAQKELADRAMRQAQEPFGEDADSGAGAPGEPGPGQPDGAQGGRPGAQGGSLADRQRALREDLGRQRGLLPGTGTGAGDEAGRQIDRAGRAMEEAERALRDGDAAGAMERQAEAIEALREGLRALGRAQIGGQSGGENPEQGPREGESRNGQDSGGSGRTDPLGRNFGGDNGLVASGDSLAEGAEPAARAREIQDEIRRRSSEQARPRDERDYLGRLLDRF